MKKGIAPYEDRGEQLGISRSGWGWDSRLADFDNDGVLEAVQATGFVKGRWNRWPELHEVAMGNDQLLSNPNSWHQFSIGDDLGGHEPNPFFVRAADGRFYDIGDLVGTGQPQVTRAIATADVDSDGDLDFVVGNQWDDSRFYRNNAPSPGQFLGLRLLLALERGARSTAIHPGRPELEVPVRPAIGATVHITLDDGRKLIGLVDGGNGHSGVRSPEVHLGLGDVSAELEVMVTVKWRDTAGNYQRQQMKLTPGWHTVLLGDSPSEEQLSSSEHTHSVP